MMSLQNKNHDNGRVLISWAQPKAEIQNGYPALSLPGFRSFMDPKKSGFRKKIWFMIFLCCFFVSVAQISERVRYYLTYPISMTLAIEKSYKGLGFPKICICNQHGFNNAVIDKALKDINGANFTDLVHIGNMTLDELWSISGAGELDAFLENCTYGSKECNSQKYWKTTYTILGKCYILDLGKHVQYNGHASRIKVKLRESKHIPANATMEHIRWKVLLYDGNFNVNYDVLQQGSYLYKASQTTLMYWHKKYYYVDTPNRPCLPAHIIKKCESRCYDVAMLNGFQCKLPFMETVSSFPYCSAEQLKVLYTRYPTELIFKLDKNQCVCGNPCFESAIDVQPDSRQAIENLKMEHTIIEVFPSRPETEVIKQVRVYNLPTLFSDIGGALGLYLGMSVLTFLEIFETITKTFIRKLRHSYLHGKPM